MNIAKPSRVLIIDDDESMCFLAGEWLNLQNIKTDFIMYPQDVYNLSHPEKYDLILLDINMPDISGFEICKYFKSKPFTSDIPIIYLTASSKPANILKAFKTGVVDFIQKPFSGEELIARVSVHIKLRQANASLQAELAEKERSNERLERLLSISQLKVKSNSALMEQALEQAVTLTRSQYGILFLANLVTGKFNAYAFSSGFQTSLFGDNPLLSLISRSKILKTIAETKLPVIENQFYKYAAKDNLSNPSALVQRMLALPIINNDTIVALPIVFGKTDNYSEIDLKESTLLWEAVWNIAELKKAEQALDRSEKRYKLLFENMTQGFTINKISTNKQGISTDFEILVANPAFENITKLKAEDFIGVPISKSLPEIHHYWKSQYADFINTSVPVNFVVYIAELEKHLEIYAFQTGKENFATLFNDVSERIKAENALKKEVSITHHLAQLFVPVSSEHTSLIDISKELIKILKSLTGCQFVFVSEIHPHTHELMVFGDGVKFKTGKLTTNDQICIFQKDEMDLYQGIPGYSLNTCMPFYANSPENFPSNINFETGDSLVQNLLSVPIIVTNKLLGEITLANSPVNFNSEDIASIQRFADSFAIAIERKRAEKELKLSEKKYRTLIEGIDEGIAVMDINDTLIFANHATLSIFNLTEKEFIGRNFHDFLKSENINNAKLISSQKGNEKSDIFEIRTNVKNKIEKYILLTISQNIEKGIYVGNILIFRDITSIKLAEIELTKSEEKFRNIFNNSKSFILLVDKNLHVVESNLAYVSTFKEYTNFQSSNLLDIVIADQAENLKENIENLFAESLVEPQEYEANTPENSKIYLEAHFKLIEHDHTKMAIVTFRNITETKEIDRIIINTIIQSEENERRRFAVDLHDGLGPILSTIKLYIRALELVSGEEKKKVTMQKINETIDEAILDMRQIANNLSPHILQNFGLQAALEAFFARIQSSNTTQINFEMQIEERLPEDQEVALYRICQELTHNTLRHAKATQISIIITHSEKQLMLQYSDNGVGFDVNTHVNKNSSMGLINIKNRVKALNGAFSMNSTVENGTNCQIRIKI